VLAEMYALSERGELGERFEVTSARFFSFGLSRIGMVRQHRSFLLLHAWGRLAQCRTARTEAAAEVRLMLARRAVKQLRAVANRPLLRAGYRQCQAELHILEGRPDRAIRLLGTLKPQREDAPLLGFEIHRTTARAMLAAGFPADSRRQVLAALALAEAHRWPSRVRRLEQEFEIQPSAGRSCAERLERSTRAARRRHDLARLLRRVLPANEPRE
jgi:hypothetical protein